MKDTTGYLDMELLRFSTAGSVDDGKSTLIGRLLYDSKSIFEDQLQAVKDASKRLGGEEVNLALLTDGLRAEREQGITIDVAYRYFATPKRKFIIADTPGHIEYTRNMVTGASTADVAIILIDARNGIIEQSKRHSYIASLLQIPNVVVAVNKMDLVDFDETVFTNPFEIDFNRGRNPHLSFGFGPHTCLGNHIAEIEAKVFLEALLSSQVNWQVMAQDIRFHPAPYEKVPDHFGSVKVGKI
jgi:small GTP-binding protein